VVGHESVDPKPQAKADLVTGVIFVYFLTVFEPPESVFLFFFNRERDRSTTGMHLSKSIYIHIETPPWLRRKGIRSWFRNRAAATSAIKRLQPS